MRIQNKAVQKPKTITVSNTVGAPYAQRAAKPVSLLHVAACRPQALPLAILSFLCMLYVQQAHATVLSNNTYIQQAPQEFQQTLKNALENGQMFSLSNTFSGQVNTQARMQGHAQVWMNDIYLSAERIDYDYVTGEIQADQAVEFSNGQIQAKAVQAHYNVDKEMGDFDQVQYHLLQNVGLSKHENTDANKKLDAYGSADKISIAGDGIYHAKNIDYSTCPPQDRVWYLQSDDMTIDQVDQSLQARQARLVFGGVPILKTPYFSSTLNGARRSGFLMPRVGINSRAGVDVTMPYYINIAPWHDATLYPRLLSKRGLQLGGEFRYAYDDHQGVIGLELLPKDSQTKNNRWAYRLKHETQTSLPNTSVYVDAQRVSDDQYANDFGMKFSDYTKTLYAQEVGARTNWQNQWGNGDALLRYKHHQALAPNIAPHDLAPQLRLTQRKNFGPWLLDWQADATYFDHTNLAKGMRTYQEASASRRWQNLAYFIEPKVQVRQASYRIKNTSNVANWVIPTLSVDAGLFFEKNWTTKSMQDAPSSHKNYVQTLEPRIFYVYTPYRRQNAPLFDTAESEFGFASLFQNNRFVGRDRVGDTHQISMGLATRWLDEEGKEKAWLQLGQRYQLTDTKVNITQPLSKGLSDLLLQGRTQWANVSANIEVQYNPKATQLNKLSTGFDWQPSQNRQLGISYTYRHPSATLDAQVLRQLNLQAKTDVAQNWRFFHQSAYDIQNKRFTSNLNGLEYVHSCWQAKFGLDRVIGTDGRYTTRGVFQLVLNGLGN